VRYISRHTAEGVIRRAKKDGFLSVTMFGLNANTPLKDAQDPCSALLGAQVSLDLIPPPYESSTEILHKAIIVVAEWISRTRCSEPQRRTTKGNAFAKGQKSSFTRHSFSETRGRRGMCSLLFAPGS
jgi:hypothetical protein